MPPVQFQLFSYWQCASCMVHEMILIFLSLNFYIMLRQALQCVLNININRLISQIILSNLGILKFLKVIHCVLICDCFFWSYHFPDWINTIIFYRYNYTRVYFTTVTVHTHSLGDANFCFSLDFCQLGFPHRILLQTRNISGKVEILDIGNIFLNEGTHWKFDLKVSPAEQLVPNMKVEYVPGHWQYFP